MTETIQLLVADDEALERAVIIETITSDVRCDENYQIQVYQAQDGNEAMEIFSRQDISAAFLDVRMPGKNGLEVAEQIKLHYPEVKFTFISAYGDYPMLRKALNLEAKDYLLKPVRRREIVNAFWKMVDPQNLISEKEENASGDINCWNTLDPTKRIINAAKSYVLQNLRKQLTLREVADHVGFSVSYFSTLFSKEEDMTFKEFVIQSRIERAKVLLENTNLPMKTIARETGFQDPDYFSKVFSQKVGTTPSRYHIQEGKEDDWKDLLNKL
ncbi:response regulator transcription factor [Dehalobacterium formicoaceticum]|uniref:Stage 0 sporulation protein A homolog n=1 Tax=Dehalobacterium formicoaceticum TaxID=51515 RepID=A0ABT1Y816_9FIRM|nr:AraC family transcriptional regulator [Dehalobacterium formicoaceticum]MCR6547008.1 AraC family transcriptional regulator [Dehalobacterium formicoaceticum]